MNVIVNLPKPHGEVQRQFMEALLQPSIKEVWVACGTKFGKCLDINEMIPTTAGFKRMADIVEGDYVFDEHGAPTEVVFATDPMYDHDCYRVVFSDGNEIVANGEHLWVTLTHADRKNIARVKSNNGRDKSTTSDYKARTTREIRDTLKYKSRPNHSIDCVSQPVEYPHRELPLDPYVLGAWLGDGSARCGMLTNIDHEVIDSIKSAGFEISGRSVTKEMNILKLVPILRRMSLIENKHVPSIYLTSSPEQRLALLQGLMDTDGTVDKRGNCCFDNTNKSLCDAVEELANSMGIKTNRAERYGKLNGVIHKKCYRVYFTTGLPVFRIKRKLVRLKTTLSSKSYRRYITDVIPIDSVPVKCIRVASERHLFLAGKAFIPTHNTVALSVIMSRLMLNKRQGVARWIAPTYAQAFIGQRNMARILPPDPHTIVTQYRIDLPFLNTRCEYRSGDKPENLEGEAVNVANALDECAKLREAVYASARTTVTMTRAPMIGVSTPRGKNWFYTKCMEAREHSAWAKSKGIPPERIFLHAPTWANPMVRPEVIEDMRKSLPDRLFRQYVAAEFIDGGTTFIGFRDCMYTDLLEFYDDHQQWFHDSAPYSEVVIGVDWAKVNDWTVFFAADLKTKRIVGFERFHKRPYTEAIRQLVRFSKKFMSVEAVWHDKTGVGEAIDDQLAFTNLPYEGKVFTNKSKNDFVSRLITSVEQKRIGLPRWNVLDFEMDSYEVTTTELGTMTYSAPSGQHDDTVSSLMLCNAALEANTDNSLNIDYVTEDIGDLSRIEPGSLEAYYADIGEDDD